MVELDIVLDCNYKILTVQLSGKPATLGEAFAASIGKWLAYLKGISMGFDPHGSISPHNCGLCQYRENFQRSCFNCPIYKYTKSQSCELTPFAAFSDEYHFYREVCEDFDYQSLAQCAKKEIRFLKRLAADNQVVLPKIKSNWTREI